MSNPLLPCEATPRSLPLSPRPRAYSSRLMEKRILSIAITDPAFIESRGLHALAAKVNAMRSSFHVFSRVFPPTATSSCRRR